MIDDYSAEIKIAIFQSVSESQGNYETMHAGPHQSLGLTSCLDSMNSAHFIELRFEFKAQAVLWNDLEG